MSLRDLSPALVCYLLVTLLLLNVADGLVTASFIAAGVGEEANPVMRWFLDVGGIPLFLGVKLAMVPAVALVLWIGRREKLAAYGTLGLVTVYLAVAFHHYNGLLTTGI